MIGLLLHSFEVVDDRVVVAVLVTCESAVKLFVGYSFTRNYVSFAVLVAIFAIPDVLVIILYAIFVDCHPFIGVNFVPYFVCAEIIRIAGE